MQIRNCYSLVLFLLVCFCQLKKEKEAIPVKDVDIKSETQSNVVENTFMIEDTMIFNAKDDLSKTPDSEDKNTITIEQCTVYVVDKNLIPNKTNLGKGSDDFFIKVKTISGQIGYVYARYLITKTQYKQHQDSLSLWSRLSMPAYKELIGRSYLSEKELPPELGSGAFVSVGEDSRYGITLFYNKYNGNYVYIFFQKSDSTKENTLIILDIIALDWTSLDQKLNIWMQQCSCMDTTKDCSDVVALYYHNEEMASKNIMVKPEKAWRPDYSKQKLVEIDPETVRCGSMAPEEAEF